MTINDTCNKVTVYNYYKSIESNDKRYLIKNFYKKYVSKNIELELTEDQIKKLDLAFDKVTSEYEKLNVNKLSIQKKKAEIEIAVLAYRHEIITRVIDIYKETSFIGVFDVLNEIEINFDKEADVNKEVKKLISKCKHIRNSIKIKKINYSKKFNNESEDRKSSLLKDISKRAMYISLNLEMKSTINIEKTTLFDWVNLNEMNEAKIALVKSMRNGKT